MSEKYPSNLKYTKEHEWILLEGNTATIGVTEFAQSSLGDIVFVELPENETQVKANDSFGVIESIKSVSDLYSPVSGKVSETNSKLSDSPELINQNAYENWILKIEISDASELNTHMSAKEYKNYCENG